MVQILVEADHFATVLPHHLRHGDAGFFAPDLQWDLPAVTVAQRSNVVFSEAGELFDADGVLPESFLSQRHHARDIERFERKRMRALADPVAMGEGLLWITDRLSHNYYHWICDSLPRLEAWLIRHETARLILPRRVAAQRFVRDSLAAYSQVTLIEPPPAGHSGLIAMVLLTSRAAGEGKHHPLLTRKVGTRLRGHFSGEIPAGNKRLHVSRAGSRFRKLANEAALLPVFGRQGIETVHLEKMQFGQQLRLLKQASMMCGAHGAGLANMLFMVAGAQILELRRPGGTPNCFFTLAAVCGHHYSALACQPEAHDAHHHTGDIVADPQALQAALAALAP